MKPFIVTARMAEPIVTYRDGLHLDGPLAFACFQDLTPEARAAVPPIESPWAEDFDLPLAKWEGEAELFASTDPRLTSDGEVRSDEDGVVFGTVWGWRCSAAIAVSGAVASVHDQRRKPAIEEMVRWSDDGRVEIGGGPRAARNLRFPSMVARELRWYAVGDPERALALLRRHVPAIGKLARSGNGRVLEWTVESTENDWSVRGPHGEVMRRLPARMVPDHPSGEGAIRAPYHHRSRWVSSVAPEAWGSGC
jgi:hypothetical protein